MDARQRYEYRLIRLLAQQLVQELSPYPRSWLIDCSQLVLSDANDCFLDISDDLLETETGLSVSEMVDSLAWSVDQAIELYYSWTSYPLLPAEWRQELIHRYSCQLTQYIELLYEQPLVPMTAKISC